MWIVTEHGFFTFVTDRKDSRYLWLRARVRADLERNFPDVTVEEHPGADYLYRAKVLRTDVADRIAQMVLDGRITSHFKDEALRTAPATKHGSRRSAYYGFWTAMAALQPYAPYSKNPRPEPVVKTWTPKDRTVGSGQSALFSGSENRGLYGGAGAGYKASDFDWDSRDWGGKSSPDPKFTPSDAPAPEATDDELDDWWAALTPEEQQAFLDQEEDDLRAQEADEYAAAHRSFGVTVTDVLPAPANRPGTRRQRRKEERRNKRQNRHNQHNVGTQADYEEKRAQRNREGLNGQEAQNRQAYLDKKAGKN